AAEHALRRPAEFDVDLGPGEGQALPRPDEKGHTAPPPGVHEQLDGHIRLDLRILRDAVFIRVSVVLPADEVLRFDRADGPQHFGQFIADAVLDAAAGRLHRQVADDLHEVVLQYVADRPDLLVELAPALDAERLGHRDLDAVKVIAIPDRFQEGVGEAEEDQ